MTKIIVLKCRKKKKKHTHALKGFSPNIQNTCSPKNLT